MARSSFHGMIVPIVSDTISNVKAVVHPHERGHFSPQRAIRLFTKSAAVRCSLSTVAASTTSSTAHSTDRHLHGHNYKHDVEHSSLTEPQRQMGRHSVVCEVVSKQLGGNEKCIDIEHPPVEPSPAFLILGFLLHSLVQDPPLQALVRYIQHPRNDLSPNSVNQTTFFWHLT